MLGYVIRLYVIIFDAILQVCDGMQWCNDVWCDECDMIICDVMTCDGMVYNMIICDVMFDMMWWCDIMWWCDMMWYDVI